MTESNKFTNKFKRPAMLAGNKAGKLPHPARKLGKWLWPSSAAALVLGSVWGVSHIEDQLERSAPKVIQKVGLDASKLEFDANYRHVKVTGILPENTSADHLEMVLAKYRGENGETIRKATVHATNPVIVKKEPVKQEPIKPVQVKKEPVKQAPIAQVPVKQEPAPIKSTPKPEPEDVIVSAITDGEKLSLTGMVPTEQHATIINDAALHSFSASDINNTLTVTGKPATIANAEEHINDFATVLSNLEDNFIDAQIDLDNDVLSGNIATADADMSQKIKTIVPNSLIKVDTWRAISPAATTNPPTESVPIEPVSEWTPEGVLPNELVNDEVITDYQPTENSVPMSELTTEDVIPDELVANEAITDYRPTDSIASLQDEFTLLAESIREFVVFAPASDVLQPSAAETLDDIVAALDAFTEVLIEIAGHTDSQSSATYNQELFQRRAQAVATYLTDQGLDETRLRANGYGESQPIASNDTEDGRSKNRRVEFWAF